MNLQISLEFIAALSFYSILFLASLPLLMKIKEEVSRFEGSIYTSETAVKIAGFLSKSCNRFGVQNFTLRSGTYLSASYFSFAFKYKNYTQFLPVLCNCSFDFAFNRSAVYTFKTEPGGVVVYQAN